MFDLELCTGNLGQALDLLDKEAISTEVLKLIQDTYFELAKDLTSKKTKYKFFDAMGKSIAFGLDGAFSELGECLKSENVELDQHDIRYTLDVLLRIFGFDRAQSEGDKLEGISSIIGPVHINVENELSEEDAKIIGEAFEKVNNLLDKKVVNVDLVKSNIPTIYKEYGIFLNDLFTLLRESTYEGYTSAAAAEGIKFFYTRMEHVGDCIILESTLGVDKIPEKPAIISGTFAVKKGEN